MNTQYRTTPNESTPEENLLVPSELLDSGFDITLLLASND
jgi:hypothetical protein